MFSKNTEQILNSLNVVNPNDDANDYYIFSKLLNSFSNVYNFVLDIKSNEFWKLLKDEYSLKDENIVCKTEFKKNDEKVFEEFTYQIKLDIGKDEIYLTFNEFYFTTDDVESYDKLEEKDIDDGYYYKIVNLKIYYKQNTKDSVLKLIEKIKNILKDVDYKNKFYIITPSQYGGYTLSSAYVKDIDIDVELNYGVEFIEIDKKIRESLTNKKSGLYLFRGEPGTGKTYYIRKIISDNSVDKIIIYVPAYMMERMADPEMVSFISKFKNSILILEDAEEVLTKSNMDRSQGVSNILNFSDGLLSDFLNIKIIATFNVNKNIIDKALTRAGRLIVDYNFKKLNPENATKLSEKLGLNQTYTTEKTLSEIYEGINQIIHSDDLDKKTTIGFKQKNI